MANLNRSITIINLSPGIAYYVRFSSPTQVNSQVSEAMETKAIGNYGGADEVMLGIFNRYNE